MTWYRAAVLFGLAVVAAVATWNAVHARLLVDGMGRLESGRVDEPVELELNSMPPTKIIHYSKVVGETTITFDCTWDCTEDGLKECNRLWKMICDNPPGGG